MNLNTAFKHSQHALNSIQRQVKQILEDIQFLDKHCLQLEFNLDQMRDNYLSQLTQQTTSALDPVKLEDIAKLQEQLKQLTNQKILLAEQIETIVNRQADNVETSIISTAQNYMGKLNLEHEIRSQHLYTSGLRKHKGRQKNINPQIKNIIKQYYHEKDTQRSLQEPSLRRYCHCKPQKKLQHPQSMIECENPTCKIGWFHFQCVGISQGTIPTMWYCPKCHLELLSEVNTVTYKLNGEQVEVGVRKEEKTDQEEEEEEVEVPQVKRKRGRPRKYPAPEESVN